MPKSVVFFRPLLFEHRLGTSVSELLFPVGSDRIAPVMPDHCGWMETDRPSFFCQPPAEVHVVASGTKLRIKSTDGAERRTSNSHIAARNVFGFSVCYQHMQRSTRRVSDAFSDGPIVHRRDVGTTNGRMISRHESMG